MFFMLRSRRGGVSKHGDFSTAYAATRFDSTSSSQSVRISGTEESSFSV